MADEKPHDVELVERLLVQIGMAMEDSSGVATDRNHGSLKARLSEIGVAIRLAAALHVAALALTERNP